MNDALKMTKTNNIGASLYDSGKITAEQVARILQYQKENKLRFGEAAVALGYVTEVEVRQILAGQFDYPYLEKGEGSLSQELVAAYAPFSAEMENLRALRNQLMLRWLDKESGTNALAIVSADRGDGRSWLAANLAIIFSQLGERTLLVDANLRTPRQHTLFGLENKEGLSQMLADRMVESSLNRIPKFRDLTVLPAGPTPPNPQELICCSSFQILLNQWMQQYDVVLIDTPAFSQAVDAQSIAGKTHGALLLTHQGHTRFTALSEIKVMLDAADAKLVGAIISKH